MKPGLMHFIVRSSALCAVAIFLCACGTATFSKSGSDARIESLRNFHLAFIDQFAVPGKRFDRAAFEARVREGNAKFQQAISEEKFAARSPVLIDLKAQFDADAAHLQSKASRGRVTPALASEMKKDVNKIYDHVLGRKKEAKKNFAEKIGTGLGFQSAERRIDRRGHEGISGAARAGQRRYQRIDSAKRAGA